MNSVSRRTLLGALAASTSLVIPYSLRASLPLPLTALRLTRVLTRELFDGEVLSIKRDWAIRFSQAGRGISLSGEQLSAKVDCPPKLAELARLEEQRSTQAMFPILLSSDGLIMGAGPETSAKDLAAAVDLAEQEIRKRPYTQVERQQHLLNLAQLQQVSSSLFDNLPLDLFFPTGAMTSEVRPIILPDGSAAEYELKYHAVAQAHSPLLHRAERTILTRVAASQRMSSEVWTLENI